jgi:dynein heavy chain
METIFNTILNAFYYNFSQEIKDAIGPLVSMTLKVYNEVMTGPLKPTPSRSHYTFNLRDVSRINQGLCSAAKRDYAQPVQIIRLWVHENYRVFSDRLIDNKDRDWMAQLLSDEALPTFGLEKDQLFNAERLIYGDYMDGLDQDVRYYRQVDKMTGLVEKVEEFLEDYNSAVKI